MSGLFVKLDVEYASDDKMVEAGPMAELLFVRGLCFCKRNAATDGEISSAQLALVAVGIPNPKKHAARLVEVAAWSKTERGWRVAAWLKRNRSNADIQAQLEMASALGIQGNHDRWHTGAEGKISAKCPICLSQHRGKPDRVAIGVPDEVDRRNPIGGSSPEEEEEEETEVKPEEETEPEAEEEKVLRSSSVEKRVCQSRVTETGPRLLAAGLAQILGETA